MVITIKKALKKVIFPLLLSFVAAGYSLYSLTHAESSSDSSNIPSVESSNKENSYELNENSELSENNSDSDSSKEENSHSEDLKIRDLLSSDAKFIFDSIDRKTFDDDIYSELNLLYKHFENIYFNDDDKTKLVNLSVLNLLIQKGVLDSSKNDAEKIIDDVVSHYLNNTRSKYDSSKYDEMLKNSNEFGNHAKHTKSCNPENVIITFNGGMLRDFPIIYNDNILISLNDIINLIGKDYEIEYMKNNPNVVLKIDKNIIEIEPGSNTIYVDEKKEVLNSQVINWKGNIFISTDIFDHLDNNVSGKSLRTVRISKTDDDSEKVIIF